VIDNLVGSNVSQAGGSCSKESDGLGLSFPDGTEEFVAYAPTDQQTWRSRFKWVEKQSALFILNAPILYAIKWERQSRRKVASKSALRLSVGLSLSVGPALPKRYTCILKRGGKFSVIEGGYLRLGEGTTSSTLAQLPEWAEAELEKLSLAVLEACEEFEARPQVQQAILGLGEKRRDEMANLGLLYRRKQGSNDRLYGLPEAGTEGSVSIEAELRRLQNIVLDRYRLRVRVRVLSLGVLEGDVPSTIYEIGG